MGLNQEKFATLKERYLDALDQEISDYITSFGITPEDLDPDKPENIEILKELKKTKFAYPSHGIESNIVPLLLHLMILEIKNPRYLFQIPRVLKFVRSSSR